MSQSTYFKLPYQLDYLSVSSSVWFEKVRVCIGKRVGVYCVWCRACSKRVVLLACAPVAVLTAVELGRAWPPPTSA